MIREKSQYKCPVCGKTAEYEPCIRVSCSNCNVLLDETKQAIITKGKTTDAKAKTSMGKKRQ